jgi:hypothetical protein
MTPENDLALVQSWFTERGFGIQLSRDEDEFGEPFFWADLTRLPGRRVVAPMYGRGSTEVEAAHSARLRFEVEQ